MRTRHAYAALAATAVLAVAGGYAAGSGAGSTVIAGSGSVAADSAPDLTPNVPVFPGGSDGSNGGSSGSGGGTSNGTASARQQVGIVTVVSVLKYQNAEGAGTGMVLSSDGEILTNNHVVNGATSITVTVETTGRSYRADVVGTAPTEDVAVIKLRNASGLQTAKFAGSAAGVKVGDTVTGVGNAGGTGTLTSATGAVTALDQAITASNEGGGDAEKLTRLIQTNAPIISGDSGGPLYDSSGDIVGMNTAASTNLRTGTAAEAYAIAIQNARSVADKIESGVETAAIHIGYPGFLGVSTVSAGGAGAGVSALLTDGPAARAGIAQGSTITAIDGMKVTSPQSLRSVLTAKDPGTKVSVTWTSVDGTSHTASVTLATGPAD
ncbi:MAG TPA: trypsin-like peptidase domain-containing protein [Jatrophihabitans sp.]|jgi:S1-C subfamily serine protease|uniref:S1C family serine protease n=1 Tax=Jatrophihabitans sp. TaxID=1932789 RepID=UPI002DFFB68C|nr:trypsin-like peptidase domain-containing protein [Jatrophihabitans sp.]